MRIFGLKEIILILLVFSFCKDIPRPDLLSSLLLFQFSRPGIGVITSDFSTSGKFRVISSSGILSWSSIPVHSDAVGFFEDGMVYIVNRLNRDSIQILDPDLLFQTIAEYSVGNGTNPHGIAIYRNRAYITLYEKNYLLVTDKYSGIEMARIDLSPYTDTQSYSYPDGIPEASGIIAYQDKIYVALQRLDRTDPGAIFPVTDASYILEIDPEQNQVINSYSWIWKNPISKLKLYTIQGQDCIVVANAGNVGLNFAIDGGIEAFCFPTKDFRIVLTEQEVGGDILDFVIKNDQEGYALVEYQDLSMAVVQFNPATQKAIQVILSYKNSNGFAAGIILDPEGNLYLGESSQYPIIRVYDTNLSFFTRIIPLDQRPVDLILLP